MRTRHFSIYRYIKDIKVDIAKKRIFPSLRGTWLPSFDKSAIGFGGAINWLGIRINFY